MRDDIHFTGCGLACQPHEVHLYSREYGLEVFHYDTLGEALLGAARITEKALDMDDGVERFITLVPHRFVEVEL